MENVKSTNIKGIIYKSEGIEGSRSTTVENGMKTYILLPIMNVTVLIDNY